MKRQLTVGYGRKKSPIKPDISMHIKVLAGAIGVELLDIDKKDNKEFTPLGCGWFGCTYLTKAIVPEFSGFDNAVLKLTNDVEEAICFKHIFNSRLWEKTKHLPIIHACGGPVILSGFDEVFSTHTRGTERFSAYDIFWMIREDLPDADGSTDYNDRHVIINKAIADIKEKSGFDARDYHMGNWGVRADGTWVLRDVMCYPDKNKMNVPDWLDTEDLVDTG